MPGTGALPIQFSISVPDGWLQQYDNNLAGIVGVPLVVGESLAASVIASPWLWVPAGGTVGLCSLQTSPTGTPTSGAALTVILEQSASIAATTGTAIQSLTIPSSSSTAVTGTPAGGTAVIPAGNYVRFNCTSAGGGIGFMYQAVL